MFDWPEQIQTSPTSTFFSVIVFLPETVSVWGPPTGKGSSLTVHLPVLASGVAVLRLIADLHGDLLVRIGPAPDGHGHVALQDGVVGKHRRQPHVGHERPGEN